MASPQYLLSILLLVLGIALLLCEFWVKRMRMIAGGLGVNLLAAGIVLLVQSLNEQKWNFAPFALGGAVALALMLPIVAIRQRRASQEIAKATGEMARLSEERDAAQSALQASDAKRSDTWVSSGITFYARSYEEHFREQTGRDFGDYVRSFVLSSPPGTEFKILGIDWTELFGAAVSATSERYLRLLNDKRTSIKVILLDPRSRVALEKRLAEFNLEVDGKKRYHASHPDRIFGKVLGSVSMLADYHKLRPQQVHLKFTQELPLVCAVMNGDEAIFYLYSRCHKGWDSPLFRATRTRNGIYEFLEQYFDCLWEYPGAVVSDEMWEQYKPQLASFAEQLEQLINMSCQGPAHARCANILGSGR